MKTSILEQKSRYNYLDPSYGERQYHKDLPGTSYRNIQG